MLIRFVQIRGRRDVGISATSVCYFIYVPNRGANNALPLRMYAVAAIRPSRVQYNLYTPRLVYSMAVLGHSRLVSYRPGVGNVQPHYACRVMLVDEVGR